MSKKEDIKKESESKKKSGKKETMAFEMKMHNGKNFSVVAPGESLDEDGNAESAFMGIYRNA